MPESPIRRLFDGAPKPEIDLAAVVSKSRARRIPKLAGVGALAVLTFGGLSYVGLQGMLQQGQPASDAAGSSLGSAPMFSAEDGSVNDDATKRAPAEKINLCTGSLAQVAPSQNGLALSVDFGSEANVGAASVEGTVTMTNSGTSELTGYTANAPAVTLSQDGIVLWHSNGPMIQLAREIDLAPGESVAYTAAFTPVVCGIADDSADSFRHDLPAAPAGVYQLSAAIDFSSDADAELVTSPLATITLK